MRPFLALLCCGVIGLGGCAAWGERSVRSQSPEPAKPTTKLIGDVSVPYGQHPVRAEAVALVVGLQGTGSEPGPSGERTALMAEMRTRGVDSPNSILNSKNSSLVLLQVYLRAGIQKGEQVDVELRVPSHSETTSLAGGYLMETQLREMAVLDHQVHDGYVLAIAQGPVLVDPVKSGSKDRVKQTRGRVLGGAVVTKSRPLGIVITPKHQNAILSAKMAEAINRRFHTMQKGVQVGMAKAKTDQFIELHVHPRYKYNVDRYIHVVRAIAIREKPGEQVERIARLAKELLDPDTTADAARQLEAIGRDGAEPLVAGTRSENAEVRFYAAEALAYLDRYEAAEVLGAAARENPAFRVFALTALGAMNDRVAYEQLASLLNGTSAETRYGAFRALWAMNPNDPLVLGDPAIKGFSYHVLDTQGTPMIHVTRSRRPEIVLFGREQCFRTPIVANAGSQILITGAAPNEISISKYVVNQPDQKRLVSTRVDDVVRAIVELGGAYPDVVQALEEAKACEGLTSRFEVDALPEAGRVYDRVASNESGTHDASADAAKDKADKDKAGKESGTSSKPKKVKSTDLFTKSDNPHSEEKEKEKNDPDGKSAAADSAKKPAPEKGIFAKMFGSGAE